MASTFNIMQGGQLVIFNFPFKFAFEQVDDYVDVTTVEYSFQKVIGTDETETVVFDLPSNETNFELGMSVYIANLYPSYSYAILIGEGFTIYNLTILNEENCSVSKNNSQSLLIKNISKDGNAGFDFSFTYLSNYYHVTITWA